MFISMAANRTIYTTDISAGFQSVRIVSAACREGAYEEFKPLEKSINATGTEIYPCIAADESFLLFVRNPGIQAGLFVSFREKSGAWGAPRPVDLGRPAAMPRLSPDGRHLFFTSVPQPKQGDIWWVDARAVTNLRPK